MKQREQQRKGVFVSSRENPTLIFLMLLKFPLKTSAEEYVQPSREGAAPARNLWNCTIPSASAAAPAVRLPLRPRSLPEVAPLGLRSPQPTHKAGGPFPELSHPQLMWSSPSQPPHPVHRAELPLPVTQGL